MLSYIEKLRQAPIKQRRQVALVVTVVVVGIIALVWFVTFIGKFWEKGTLPSETPSAGIIESPYGR
jgi:hypothetical protein